jgi:DNA polymerase delta subunit 3
MFSFSYPLDPGLTQRRMLYDFHIYQNKQKPNSVHATYLVYGRKAAEAQKGADGDVEMNMSSSMPGQEGEDEPEVPTFTLSLIREESLTGMLSPIG